MAEEICTFAQENPLLLWKNKIIPDRKMIKQSVYLDTSTINFLFADDAPEKKEITIDFFDNFVKTGVYEVYWSDFVTDEINQTNDDSHRSRLLKIGEEYSLIRMSLSDLQEIQYLAQRYIEGGAIPPKKIYDALHVACCTIEKIDFLASWNYKHLANVNRERLITAINYKEGYLHPLRIITPSELIYYG
ncbi:MAG: hypothetical protein R3C61_12880 [Bacteroidia bacterium]